MVGEVYDDVERGAGFGAGFWIGGYFLWSCVAGMDGGV